MFEADLCTICIHRATAIFAHQQNHILVILFAKVCEAEHTSSVRSDVARIVFNRILTFSFGAIDMTMRSKI